MIWYLELAGAAEPEVIFSWELGDSVAGLVDSDPALVAAHQLVIVKVNIAVTHSAPVTRPPHLPNSSA